jgi:tetratricopeptide (TPR) repeat protein
MRVRVFTYAVLLMCLGAVLPQAYGQNQPTAGTPNGAKAPSANDIYFDAIKAKIHDDPKKAESLFLQFVIMDPAEPSAYYELAKISYSDKKIDEADSYIKKALKLDSKNKWYKDFQAGIYSDKGDFAAAAAIAAELTKEHPEDHAYTLMAAEYYDRAHKYDDAIRYLDIAITQNGEDEEILMRKVQIYLNMNDVEKAAGTMRQIITQEPRNGKYYKLLGELYDNNKLPVKANEVYENAKRILPNDPFVQLGIAEHYLKLGDTARYMSNVKLAILNNDFDADAQLDLLKTYLQSMPSDSVMRVEGLPVIKLIVAQHPNDAGVQAFYGDMLDLNNQKDSSVAAYKRSLVLKPSNFSVWENLLQSYTGKQDADSLIKYSERAMRLFPNQAIVHYYNSVGHMNKKEYPAAIKAINRAIDMQPENNKQLLGGMYSLLADIYHTNKQDDLSDKAFEKALEIIPNDASVLNNYSYYLSERGIKLDEAERMSMKSLLLRPDEGTFLDTYGWIAYKQGKYDKAKEYIQKAINVAGDKADGTVYEHIGDVYYKLNDKDKAMQYWKMAKEKGGDMPQLDKKIKEGRLYE